MRWRRTLFGIVVVTGLVGASVVAADPTITISATRQDANGAVVITSGQGFPANQPVQASLVVQNRSYPLAYDTSTTSSSALQPVPMTDTTGAFQNFAFILPAPGQVSGTDGEIFVSVGPTTARTPIRIDSGVGTTAGRGDKIAVSIGAAFFIVAVCLIFLLLRGLPVYPIGQTTTRRGREPEIR